MNPSAFKSPAVVVVAIVLVAESLVLLGLTVFLVHEVVADEPDSIVSGIGLALMTLAATAWIAATTVGYLRGRSFARGSAVVWQFLQATVGLASNQGVFARPDIASGLFVPALIALALLLFSPAVSRHLGTTSNSD